MSYIVLKSDWDGGSDPITFYATSTSACLDFENTPQVSRSAIVKTSDAQMTDCEHGVTYDVVICERGPGFLPPGGAGLRETARRGKGRGAKAKPAKRRTP